MTTINQVTLTNECIEFSRLSVMQMLKAEGFPVTGDSLIRVKEGYEIQQKKLGNEMVQFTWFKE